MHNYVCSSVKMCKRVLTRDLLNVLHRYGIGTNEVEECVGKLCKNMVHKQRGVSLVKAIMKAKLDDAECEVRCIRKQLRQHGKELYKNIPQRSSRENQLKSIVKTITGKLWKKGKEKNRRKVAFLRGKSRNKGKSKSKSIETRGIKYQDSDLKENRDKENGEEEGNSQKSTPKLYGGVELSSESRNVLSKNPNL